MGNAIKCDLTGKLSEGEGIKHVDVAARDGLVLRVTPYLVDEKAKKKYPGVLGPEGVELIEAAATKMQAALQEKKATGRKRSGSK